MKNELSDSSPSPRIFFLMERLLWHITHEKGVEKLVNKQCIHTFCTIITQHLRFLISSLFFRVECMKENIGI